MVDSICLGPLDASCNFGVIIEQQIPPLGD